jgi:hypothetical protein
VVQICCDCSNYAREFVNWYVFFIVIIHLIPPLSLLAAMMGSTYSKVKDNLDREWKFYRYCLITEFINAPSPPPQLNPIFLPLSMLITFFLPQTQMQQNNELKASKKFVEQMNASKHKYVPVNWVI